MTTKAGFKPTKVADMLDAPREERAKSKPRKTAPSNITASPLMKLVEPDKEEVTTADKYRIGTKGQGYTRADGKVVVKFTATVQTKTDARYKELSKGLSTVKKRDFCDELLNYALDHYEELRAQAAREAAKTKT